MSTVTSTLTIGGSTVNRAASHVTLQRLLFGIQEVESLDFAQEVVGSLQGSYTEGQSVVLSMTDGTTTKTVFQGQIVSHTSTAIGAGVISVGYHCLGMRFLANQIITTGPDGTGRIAYNLPRTDPNWSLNLSGLSVGTMLADYFSQHSAQLGALGIGQPPASDLAPLTIVPTDPVILTGRIFDMADALMAQWGCNKYQLYIDPNSLQIRIVDTTALPSSTLTLGVDPIQVPSISVDTSNCYTRVVLRGGGDIRAMVVSLGSNTLQQGWTAGQQSTWNWYAFAYPSNSVIGTITSMTAGSSPSTVTANAFTGPVTTWSANYWNQAQIWVEYGWTGSTGYQTSETGEVLSCTATAGGSASFTVDTAFGSTIYTRCEIRGQPTGEALVWRKYTIPNTVQRPSDGKPINLCLSQTLNGSWPWSPTDGVVTQATGPTAEVYYAKPCGSTQQSWFATFQIYPSPDGVTPGYIVFDKPTVSIFSSQSSMESGSPDGVPCDIKVLLPYSNGAITAQAPSSGYQGTAYTRYGIQRTLYRDYPNWVARAQAANMGTLAQNILDTVKNAVIDASVVYHGVPMGLMGLGQGLNISGGLATGSQFSSMNCPIRNITVEWPDYGGSSQVTQFHINNLRKPFVGDSLFLHPIAQRGQQRPDDFTFGPGAVKYSGEAGLGLGFGQGRGETPDLGGGDESIRPRRGRTRLRSSYDRERAAEQHGANDRDARESARRVAERHDVERSKALHPDSGMTDRDRVDIAAREASEGFAMEHEAEKQEAIHPTSGRTGRDLAAIDARRSAERLARKDNARRGATLRDSSQAIVDAHRSAYGSPEDQYLAHGTGASLPAGEEA